MIKKKLKNFDIRQICDSGQCFRMREMEDGRYEVIAGDHYLTVKQEGEQCYFSCGEEEFQKFWVPYFDLEEDYGRYIDEIDQEDEYLCRAAAFGSGIRILRQDLWEMIVSFLISQQNNIVRIRKCIGNICKVYGEKKETPEGIVYDSFPDPKELAGAQEEGLRECNLGYRSKYVLRTAQSVVDGEGKLEEILRMDYEEARAELQKFYGVGGKVADCICLFALHHLQAFPVDTHIRQVTEEHYPQGFPMERYHGYEGVLQQYLFYYDLKGSRQ